MIKIENFEIGQLHKPFIIAEMSGNHNQSLERTLEIVYASAKCVWIENASVKQPIYLVLNFEGSANETNR